jgi:hypothetical protein
MGGNQYVRFLIKDAAAKLDEVVHALGTIQSDFAQAGEVSASHRATKLANDVIAYKESLMSKIGDELGGEVVEKMRQATGAKPRPQRPCMFYLMRKHDHSGVSGTGVVAEGIEFSDGRVAMRWVTRMAGSTCTYDSIDDVIEIHGHGGSTEVIYGRPGRD